MTDATESPGGRGDVLGEEIGRGTSGTVHRGLESDGRLAAIKVVAPELVTDEGFRARLLAHAEAARAIDHPHLVRLHGGEIVDGAVHLRSELLEGADLAATLRRDGPRPVAEVGELARQVADALGALAEHGLTHVDLSPSSVHVGADPGRLHVRLLDGTVGRTLADVSTSELTGAVLVGHVEQMAPERFQGAEHDARADVYALGCVLYEALTGQAPFPATNLPAAMHAHLTVPPPRAGDLVADVPPAVGSVLQTALAKDPAARFADPGELARAFVDAAEGRPAPPPRLLCDGFVPRPRPLEDGPAPLPSLTTDGFLRPTAPAPADWSRKESVTVRSPDGSANVIVSTEPLERGMTAAAYAHHQGGLLRREFPGFVEESIQPYPAFGTPDGWMRVFRWSPANGTPTFQMQIYAVVAGRGCTATATTSQWQEARHRTLLAAVLAGVRCPPR